MGAGQSTQRNLVKDSTLVNVKIACPAEIANVKASEALQDLANIYNSDELIDVIKRDITNQAGQPVVPPIIQSKISRVGFMKIIPQRSLLGPLVDELLTHHANLGNEWISLQPETRINKVYIIRNKIKTFKVKLEQECIKDTAKLEGKRKESQAQLRTSEQDLRKAQQEKVRDQARARQGITSIGGGKKSRKYGGGKKKAVKSSLSLRQLQYKARAQGVSYKNQKTGKPLSKSTLMSRVHM